MTAQQPLTIGSLFSGTGALDIAVEEVLGARTAWFCEWDDAPAKILAHHYPAIPNHRDVTQIDWETVEPVDILTGGSPCQDLSNAGKRAGMTEGTRSNLWVNMREAIATIQPKLVVWENVLGALSATAISDSDMEPGSGSMGDGGGNNLRALGRVLGDLAEIGYDAQWTTLRASDIGSPHHRERVFLVATSADPDSLGLETQRCASRPAPKVAGDHDGHRALAGIGGAADIEREIKLRWGDAAGSIMAWALIHGCPPPVITDHVTYHDESIWGKAFPEVKPSLNPAFSEWMMGLPAGWITDVPGLSRADQLKAAGNGVVPQQAAAALRQLLPTPTHSEVTA